ncbi:hypothetical protein K469DRAFT_701939 [Zopfia rhizophila CBS 207.26]|uniref:Uncharacterized protein n=1 Tax=Zopfia rhizophila CBS 207.26 TaxID=1314779 RepID=A0A6A6EFI3_9PEZI|nr:hypothetical protein K469DRAFT_701939 [Zopfia rhizophila CBS 207.26]
MSTRTLEIVEVNRKRERKKILLQNKRRYDDRDLRRLSVKRTCEKKRLAEIRGPLKLVTRKEKKKKSFLAK